MRDAGWDDLDRQQILPSTRTLGDDQERSAEWPYWFIEREIEMNNRSGGVGIVGVIVIVLVILWLVGVIKL